MVLAMMKLLLCRLDMKFDDAHKVCLVSVMCVVSCESERAAATMRVRVVAELKNKR